MATVYEELATQTRRVLDERGWSLRQAEYRTGVNAANLQHMTHGKRAGVEIIRKWAEAIHEDPAKWLTLAGYDYVGRMVEPQAPGVPSRDTERPAADVQAHVGGKVLPARVKWGIEPDGEQAAAPATKADLEELRRMIEAQARVPVALMNWDELSPEARQDILDRIEEDARQREARKL